MFLTSNFKIFNNKRCDLVSLIITQINLPDIRQILNRMVVLQSKRDWQAFCHSKIISLRHANNAKSCGRNESQLGTTAFNLLSHRWLIGAHLNIS
jgi:hypothetical protein